MNSITTNLPGVSSLPRVQQGPGDNGNRSETLGFASVMPLYEQPTAEVSQPVNLSASLPVSEAPETQAQKATQSLAELATPQPEAEKEAACGVAVPPPQPTEREQSALVSARPSTFSATGLTVSQSSSEPLTSAALVQPGLKRQPGVSMPKLQPIMTRSERKGERASQSLAAPAIDEFKTLSSQSLTSSKASVSEAARMLKEVTAVEASQVRMVSQLEGGESRLGRPDEGIATAHARPQMSTPSQWGPLPLDSSVGAQSLGKQMLAPLKEQVRFSLDQGITKAEIRLDPPELGRIDLSVRHEGERITVQLSAANPQVREALMAGAERLREEMSLGVGSEVQVDVGQGAPQEKQQEYSGWNGQPMVAQESTAENAAVERDLFDMLA